MAELIVDVRANTADAVKQLDRVQSELTQTAKAANTASTAMPKLGKATAGANTALVNFGRVVQDAPFGLIGIANNIDPLLTSFSQLKKETGSTGAAFKSLAAGLAGPAGIAIAVSAVTSAFIAFGPQIEKALTGLNAFDTGLVESFKKGAESAKKAQLDFEKYASIINDGNASTARQKDALNDVNKSLSEYGLKINTVADFQRNSAEVSALFVKLKQEEAKSQILAAKAAEEYGKQIEAAFKGSKAGLSGANFASNNPLFQFRAIQQRRAADEIEKSEQLEKAYTNAVKESDKQIASIIEQLKKVKGVTEQFGGSTKTVIDILKQYRQELNFLTFKEQATGVDLLRQKIELASKTFEDFNRNGVSPTSAAFQRVGNDLVKFIDQLETIRKIQEKIQSSFNENPAIILPQRPTTPRVNINNANNLSIPVLTPEALKKQGEYSALLDRINEQLKKQQELAKTISDTINNGIAAGIDQFFNALANNQNPFEALTQSVKRLVVELAAAVVKMFVLKQLANSLAPGSGEALGASGLLSGISGFATGGFVSQPTLATIAENGPEFVLRPDQLGAIMNMGGGGGFQQVGVSITGEQLYILLQRTTNRKARNF